jgi:hypothetical protein
MRNRFFAKSLPILICVFIVALFSGQAFSAPSYLYSFNRVSVAVSPDHNAMLTFYLYKGDNVNANFTTSIDAPYPNEINCLVINNTQKIFDFNVTFIPINHHDFNGSNGIKNWIIPETTNYTFTISLTNPSDNVGIFDFTMFIHTEHIRPEFTLVAGTTPEPTLSSTAKQTNQNPTSPTKTPNSTILIALTSAIAVAIIVAFSLLIYRKKHVRPNLTAQQRSSHKIFCRYLKMIKAG